MANRRTFKVAPKEGDDLHAVGCLALVILYTETK